MKNKYPRGKLNDSDEVELLLEVYERDKTIIFDFGKAVTWIGMDKEMAILLAKTIIYHAEKI